MVKSMCKKDKKMIITGTNKEIALGDEITYAIKVTFKRYPELVFESEYTCNIDEEMLKSLTEEEFITVKEDKPVEEYTTYLKWLADVEGFKYSDILSSFGVTLKVNPNAALSILLKAISRKMNKDVAEIPRKVWLINITTKEIFIADVKNANTLKNIAWFLTKADAEYALKVCEPVLKSCEE